MDIRAFFGKRVSRNYFWLYLAAILWISYAWGMFQSLIDSAETIRTIDMFIRYGSIGIGIVVTIGRMHDIGKSGWFAFLPIYNLVIPVTRKGDARENRFGPPPQQLAPEIARAAAGLMFVGLFILLIALLLALSVILK